MAASSSSTLNLHKYDVFVSFRGEDTREKFVSHLHKALCDKKINTYVDYRLGKGDEILPSLIKAIEESHISVIIFSENFASSSWCLNELLHILSCQKKEKGMVVIPVFYCIDPSVVRKQQGSYATAFKTLENRFPKDKLDEWRTALKATADIVGWNSQAFSTEAIFIEAIVKDIVQKLYCWRSSADYNNLIGLSRRVEKIESLLHIGSQDVRTVGICGLGGIGKTTLSRIVFDRLSFQFEGFEFLESIGQTWEKGKNIKISKKLYSTLLKEETTGLTSKDRLRRTRVIIVADDVDDPRQLELLTGVDNKPLDNMFGPGSRIIITSRDKKLLKSLVNDDMIYEVEGLNYDEALELFRLYAFKRNSPTTDGTILSDMVIQYANGIPLALKLLGSLFNGKSIEMWRSALEKLENLPDKTIQDVLKISYDGLDDIQKSIFLDIACFFRGNYKDFVERILKHATTVIDDLIDKSLVTIMDNKFRMHDLIHAMGQEIVRQESTISKELGTRSRLWISQDVCHVLENNTGTAAVEGIFLDMSEIGEVDLRPNAFEKMYSLRLLKIYNNLDDRQKCKVNLSEDLRTLPSTLTYLHWEGYPSKSLPQKFNAKSLVELSMPNSQIIKLQSDVELNLSKLKKIDLSYSKNLTEISILSQAPNLEHIYLEYCTSLTEVPSELQYLEKLKTLYLEGCSSLKKFPELPKNLICLVLNKTAIEEVQSISFECLYHLQVLCMRNCKTLLSLPTTICKLKSLDSLSLSGCSKLERFPEILEPMEKLRMVQLDRTGIDKLPNSMKNLTGIEHFLTESTKIIQRNKCKSEFSECCSFFRLHSSDKSPDPVTGKRLKEALQEKTCLTMETVSISRSALSQPLDDLLSGQEFIFCNFIKLRSTIEFSEREVIRSFTGNIDLSKIQKGRLHADFGLCFPKRKIPSWYSHQSENSWIRINFDKISIDTIRGFAVCAVVDFVDNYLDRRCFKLLCQAHYILSDGSFLSWDFYEYNADKAQSNRDCFQKSKSHVHPKDGSEEKFSFMRNLIIGAFFEFSCVDENNVPLEKCNLKKCGVHPFLAERVICISDASNGKEFEPSGSRPVDSYKAEQKSKRSKTNRHEIEGCKPLEIVSIPISMVAQILEKRPDSKLVCYNFLEYIRGEAVLRNEYFSGNAKPSDLGAALREFKREFTLLREELECVGIPKNTPYGEPFLHNSGRHSISPDLFLDLDFLGFIVTVDVEFIDEDYSDFKLLCRSVSCPRHRLDWNCGGHIFSCSSSLQEGEDDRSFNLNHKFQCYSNNYENTVIEFELLCVDENYKFHQGCFINSSSFQPVYAKECHLIPERIRKLLRCLNEIEDSESSDDEIQDYESSGINEFKDCESSDNEIDHISKSLQEEEKDGEDSIMADHIIEHNDDDHSKLIQEEENDNESNVLSDHIINHDDHDYSELLLEEVAAHNKIEPLYNESEATPFVYTRRTERQ